MWLESPDKYLKYSSEILKRWLISPQLTWLSELQVKPREWVHLVENLDALSLDEMQRGDILQKRIEEMINCAKTSKYKPTEFANSQNYIWIGK